MSVTICWEDVWTMRVDGKARYTHSDYESLAEHAALIAEERGEDLVLPDPERVEEMDRRVAAALEAIQKNPAAAGTGAGPLG